MSPSDSPAPWYETAFARPYLTVYAHRDESAAEAEAAFVARQLGVRPGGGLLDLGCGAGRHSRALARLGAAVSALDLSAPLLAHAAAAPCPAGRGRVRYVRGDFRHLPFADSAFERVASLFTAFGYFDARGDQRQLDEVARVLSSGGRFLLDFLNTPRVRATLVPESERELGGYRIVERRTIRDGRVEKRVRMSALEPTGDDADEMAWAESVRLYERSELVAAMAGVGMTVVETFGDLAGAAWDDDSPRLVLVCRRDTA